MQHKRKSEHSVQAGAGKSVPANGEVTLASVGRQNWGPLLTRVAVIGSAGSILIALLGLLSYVPGLALLGSVREGYIPMAPSTAISFIVLAIILLTISLRSLPDWTFRVIGALTMLVTLFAALEVVGHFAGIDLNFEHTLVPAAGYLGEIPIARMSPSTGALFFLAGLAVLALLLRFRMQGRETLLGHWGGGLGTLVFGVSLVFCLAYFYGSPLLYGQGATVPMALTTALAFMLLGSATVGASGENAIPVSLLVAFKRSGKPMSARRRFILLAVIMLAASGVGITIIVLMLYRQDIEEHSDRLTATVQSQARLIEAIASHDLIYEQNTPGGPTAATLSQIIDAHEKYKGFGETGEFTLARREGDLIVFILRHRHGGVGHPMPLTFDLDIAEPMRRALNGLSGTDILLDYRGETVLASYEPVDVLNLGMVAKIDLTEIRAPFIRSTLSAIAVALLFILVGTVLFFWLGNPIITRLETYSRDLEKENEERKRAEEALRESEEKYRSLIDQASDGIFICDHEGVLSEVNPAGRVLLGFADEDPSGSNIRDLLQIDNQGDDRLHLEELTIGHSILQEYGVTRKDGSKIHVEINAIRTFNNQIQGIVRNISKRKQAEKESDRLMQELIENQVRLKALSSELVRSQEQERRQIARELHDEVGQQLTAAKLRLKKYISKSGSKNTAKEITDTLEYLDDTLAIVRNISLNLHPSILDELGLAAALRWLIDRQIQISDYKIQLELGDFPDSLSEETAITIFRVTQEALNNISRHAMATEVLIKVKPNQASVIIEISDDGLGFKVDEAINIAVSGGSLGLLSMRERAGFVGGQLDIESEEGGGTIIRGSFPLSANQETMGSSDG